MAYWRSLRTAEALSSWWLTKRGDPSSEELATAHRSACFAYLSELDLAGRIGTAVHRYVELYDTNGPDDADANREVLAASLDNAAAELSFRNCLGGFRQYCSERAPLHRLASEGMVASVAYQYAGTFDRLGARKGRIVLSDFKTSKGIYFSHLVQLGAYSLAIKEWLGIKVQEFEVLRFGKDGTFEPLTITGRRAILKWEQQAIRCRETYGNIKAFEGSLATKSSASGAHSG